MAIAHCDPLTGLLPGYRLKIHHIIAAILGLAGAFLIVTEGHFNIDLQYLPGYLLACGAAFIWAVYSLLTKRMQPFGTDSVSVFCLIAGILSFTIFAATGGTFAAFQSLTKADWILIILAGLGPLGAAFYCWDAALKKGDPRTIGSLSYLTPLLSTMNLLLFAEKSLSIPSLVARF